jgi:hypothetical protein
VECEIRRVEVERLKIVLGSGPVDLGHQCTHGVNLRGWNRQFEFGFDR